MRLGSLWTDLIVSAGWLQSSRQTISNAEACSDPEVCQGEDRLEFALTLTHLMETPVHFEETFKTF